MKTYLVGGSVRDKLLGHPITDPDWVVVGARPEELTAQGYTQVGKDFPVFLHPETKDEYALARKERKQGHGYTGFTVEYEPTVTLEEDLSRRDLTINAIAEDENGVLIDPYGGQADIDKKILRHVSDAFVEDPLRVLRTARFAARYAYLGFTVAPETMTLMRAIVDQGELAHLPSERVWTEIERALGERHPQVFIETLRNCGALAALLPEVDCLFGVPQTPKYHPEIDTGVHTLMALEQATILTDDTQVRFAVLLHDLGKGTTPPEEWPRHIAHEHRGKDLVRSVCERLKSPKQHQELAMAVCEHHLLCHKAMEMRGAKVLKLLNKVDAFRRPARLEQFLLSCQADARGRKGLEDKPYPQADYLRAALSAAKQVTAEHFAAQNISGKALGEAINTERSARLDALRPG